MNVCAGEAECRSIARIAALGLQMKLMTWNRAVLSDIDAAESTGVGWAHISVPVSTVQTCSVRPELLNPLAALVSKASNRVFPEGKPIVGDMVFAHESGIHINGLLKERAAYQALDPTERALTIRSYSASIRAKVQFNICLSRWESRQALMKSNSCWSGFAWSVKTPSGSSASRT